MHFLIDHNNRFMLGWSPKCACTTIKQWFLATKGISNVENIHEYIGYGEESKKLSYIDWSNPKQYFGYRKFALARNPYYRLVSGYLNKYIYENELPRGAWKNFEQFVLTLYRDRRFQTIDKHHFSPQFSSDFAKFRKAGFHFDAILRVENLDQDIIKIYNDIPDLVRTPLHTTNKTPVQNKKDTYKAYRMEEHEIISLRPKHELFYSPSIRLKVLRIYAVDFFYLARYGIFYWQ